ncbi:MAG: hypothetical protein Q8K28_11550 [Hoeflea sp.]|uniref:hypothetical protein n=1 Tax=Hoeflea sp. TaxID=1940281 RepID=UPI0027314608|nr:hypothetical protein [Hoeflea sp.]MDP2120529.1 hypothetical protein [Hoeflea sp.]
MLQQAFQAQGGEFAGNGQHFLPVASSTDPASKTIVSAPLSGEVLELTKPA